MKKHLFCLLFCLLLLPSLKVNAEEDISTEVLEVSQKEITGISAMTGKKETGTIEQIVTSKCDLFYSKTGVEVKPKLIIALIMQESRGKDFKDGICQIWNHHYEIPIILKDGTYYELLINNKNDNIQSIEYVVATFVSKSQKILNSRREDYGAGATYSQLYVLKMYNTGDSLKKVRLQYINDYPLTEEGDLKFINDYESLTQKGKDMFKTYLTISENKVAKVIATEINDDWTYEEYTASGKLYSDPRYVQNVLRFCS